MSDTTTATVAVDGTPTETTAPKELTTQDKAISLMKTIQEASYVDSNVKKFSKMIMLEVFDILGVDIKDQFMIRPGAVVRNSNDYFLLTKTKAIRLSSHEWYSASYKDFVDSVEKGGTTFIAANLEVFKKLHPSVVINDGKIAQLIMSEYNQD